MKHWLYASTIDWHRIAQAFRCLALMRSSAGPLNSRPLMITAAISFVLRIQFVEETCTIFEAVSVRNFGEKNSPDGAL
jgi:hypothetical protein